jgi:predicted RNase H-like nuclease (RuvC/YqgF family)
MSLADTELSIGGVKFKGIYIVILVSLATTIGGFVWSASSLYSRLESVESRSIPQIAPIEEKILLIEQQLKDNDIGKLSAKLATLGTNLETIMVQQEKLLELKSELSEMSKELEAMKATVKKAELITENIGNVDERIKMINKSIEELWDGMDYLNSNPLR